MKSIVAYILVALQLLAIGESKNIVNPQRVSLISDDEGLLSRRRFQLYKSLPLDLDDKVIQDMVERAAKNTPFSQKVVRVDEEDTADMPSSGQVGVNLDTTIQTLTDISYFSSLVRDVKSLDAEISSDSSSVVIFAPSDEALNAVEKKPWQYPNDIDRLQHDGASDKEIDDAINANVATFVLSHVVSSSDFSSAEDSVEVLLKSDYARQKSAPADILLKKEGDSYYVAAASNRNYVRARSLSTAVNGVVFVIDGVLTD